MTRDKPLEDEEADALFEEVKRRNAKLRVESLAEANTLAKLRGKEPFDLEKLETMCDTSHQGRIDPVEERRKHYEYKYYVEYPEFMTLAELADLITQVSKW